MFKSKLNKIVGNVKKSANVAFDKVKETAGLTAEQAKKIKEVKDYLMSVSKLEDLFTIKSDCEKLQTLLEKPIENKEEIIMHIESSIFLKKMFGSYIKMYNMMEQEQAAKTSSAKEKARKEKADADKAEAEAEKSKTDADNKKNKDKRDYYTWFISSIKLILTVVLSMLPKIIEMIKKK